MSLCDNQDKFNDAFYTALNNSKKKDLKKMSTGVGVYMVIHLIFLFWGIMLAVKQPSDQRVVHLVLAIIFSPAYVLAYYVNEFK